MYALISLDSTMRSNVAVGPPLDLVDYARDELRITRRRRFIDKDPDLFERARKYSSSGQGLSVWVNCGKDQHHAFGTFRMEIFARKPYSSDLSDAQWVLWEPLLQPPVPAGKPRTTHLREVVN